MSHHLNILTDRVRGVIYGLLIGDALGCPVEGCHPDEILDQFGRITQMETPKHQRYRPKGLHSDDGQQALALCDALLCNPSHIPEEFGRILLELYRAPLPVSSKLSFFFGLHRGHGKNFRATVRALDQGKSVTESGQPSSGNGSAMLIAPLAIYFRDADHQTLRHALLEVAQVKTYDVRAIAATSAVAILVQHFVNHGDVWSREVQEEVVEFVQQTERLSSCETDPHLHTFSNALIAMFDEQHQPMNDVITRIGVRASETADYEVWPTLGYAVASVITSIYFATQPSTFRDAVEDVIALGGDTDTTGAMVGAMLGARYGFSSIPQDWYRALHAQGCFDDRVEGLIHRQSDWTPECTLVDLETEWCRLYEHPDALQWIQQRRALRVKKSSKKSKNMNISPKKQPPMIIEDVVIDGHWLIKELNRPAGPWVGQYLSKLRDRYQAGELTSLTDLYICIFEGLN